MILDKFTMLSGTVNPSGVLVGQTVTTTAVSTNTYDTGPNSLGGNQPSDLGRGGGLEMAICVTQAATAAGAATVNFEYIQADDPALSVNVEVLGASGPIGVALLTLGTIVPMHVERAAPYVARRYVGLRYTVATGPLTAGAFVASMVVGLQDVKNIYPRSGYSVT